MVAAARPRARSGRSIPTEHAAPPPPRRRRDPKRPRATDGVASWTKLVNEEPGRKYLWVHKHDHMRKSTYMMSGYTFVRRPTNGSDGVMPGCGHTVEPGEIISVADMVLMSVDEGRWNDIQDYGHDDISGQEAADRVEQGLIKLRGQVDAMRGVVSRYGDKMYTEVDDGHGQSTEGEF